MGDVPSQYFPFVHFVHCVETANAGMVPIVPRSQGTGSLVPSLQKYPMGHFDAGASATVPAEHMYPAGHLLSGIEMPFEGQINPEK